MRSENEFARFSVESGKILSYTDPTKPPRILPKLFQPRNDGTLSIQAIDNMSHDDIVAVGEQVRKERGKSTLYGWARIFRKSIEDQELKICVNNIPRKGHTLVIGWPLEKNLISDKQKALAKASMPILIG